MAEYITKSKLYTLVDQIRNKLRLSDVPFPLNVIETCNKRNDVKLAYMKFKTQGLRGISIKCEKDNKDDIIILDSKQSFEEQNFYCGHELIHLMLHRNCGSKSFNCYDAILPDQDKSLEWQANEGSAELLVPYKLFIPLYVKLSYKYKTDFIGYEILKKLSEMFGVTINVIENRIKNLRYEIYQYYCEKKEISEIELLSFRRQRYLGKHLLSAESYRCINCFSTLRNDNKYCHICGKKTKLLPLTKGVYIMKYPHNFKTNSNDELTECPRCKNDMVENNYCRVCGLELTNFCNNCNDRRPLNARYCSKCGEKTTYFNESILKPWNFDGDLPFPIQETNY